MKHPFTDEELLAIFEVSYQAITNIDFWEYCMAEMDKSPQVADALRDKIKRFMEEAR